MPAVIARLRASATVAMALLAVVPLTGSGPLAQAQSSSLQGSWRGSGRIVLPSGSSERARCRARFTRASRSTYRMSAVCATASARVSQTATLRRVGSGRYSGQFYNSQYDLSGNIYVRQRGNRLTASLRGGGGSARISLRR